MTDVETEMRPLILTAQLDAAAQANFDALRRAHFPPARNFLAAHLTLFHKLPGAEIAEIHERLEKIAAKISEMSARTHAPRSLGNGVALAVDCPPLLALRAELAAGWETGLTPQDRQKFQPHITVQNKVTAEKAAALLAELSGAPSLAFTLTGLHLWHYDGGPWSPAATIPFLPSLRA